MDEKNINQYQNCHDCHKYYNVSDFRNHFLILQPISFNGVIVIINFRRAGFDAGATGAHSGGIGQQHVVEEVSEEEPLRNFAGGAGLGRGLRRLRSLARIAEIETTELTQTAERPIPDEPARPQPGASNNR